MPSSTAIAIKIMATRLKNVNFFSVRSRTLSRRGTSSNLSRQMNTREDGEAEVKEGTRNSAVSAVLIREQDGKQLPIYYVSKVLQGAELHYPDAEKLAFSLLVAARKLRPYFQSHSITVLTNKPLRRILHKPDISGRLVPWSIELGEFDIRYRPCLSIKGQALTDFIVECTLPIEDEEQLPQKERPFT
ncbi:hypothetical protein RJ639_040024 [Escallonia herrerae]|uniref:Reverse transcriptase RNase H-like domain-containing protein n=1 Tax=Escallonia herrerae TaxID=1293975 RepID=A0AA88WVH6_9ASTE|nr:hypothetical protein RJ639_040024 [Escallonia herrerae]